jgi:hypothetical protein
MPVISLRHKASCEDTRPSRQLCELFSEWHWENNCFHDHVVAFALEHSEELLAAPPREHSHAVHELHKQFSASLEEFVGRFLEEQGVSQEQFSVALREQQESGDICTRMTVDVVTDELLSLMEYSSFHKVMIDALALEVNGDAAGEPADDEATLDDPSQEARQLLEDLAMHDHADAAAVVGQLRAEQRQRDIDVGGVE